MRSGYRCCLVYNLRLDKGDAGSLNLSPDAHALRNMLETYIRDHFLDIDHITVRKGSPHSLVCTKNDRSHHRALARRLADEKQLNQLSASNPE